MFLQYHHSVLGGHCGRERTVSKLTRDWWWPGLYESVGTWCTLCRLCQQENAPVSISTHARTEVFFRPFRVIQFDTIKCQSRDDDAHTKYVLTAICAFSRDCWLIPLSDKSAPSIARGLFENVFLDLAMFPTVLRLAIAGEFVGEVVSWMNDELGIRQVTGSPYHPQSQGTVERMHRTLNGFMQAQLQNNPEGWESKLKPAQFLLSVTPMSVLGNRTPYEVVTGIRPELPHSIAYGQPVRAMSQDEYIKALIEYMHLSLIHISEPTRPY